GCVSPLAYLNTLATRCEYGKRQTTVNRQDAGEFISAEEVAGKALLRALPRNFVYVVAGEDMPAVESRAAVIAHGATAVLYAAGAITLIVGQRMRPGVKEIHRGITSEALLGRKLQAVVVGIEAGRYLADGTVAHKR